MDFFGIGPLELILILLVLLIVIGPAKLPEVAGTIGRAIRKFREATAELSKDFKEMAEEVKDAEKEASTALDPTGGLSKDFKEMAKEVKDVRQEINTALKLDTGLTKDFKGMAKEIKDVTKEASSALGPTPEEEADAQKEEGEG
jgi:TatA/E family protein of Tat protein translocase